MRLRGYGGDRALWASRPRLGRGRWWLFVCCIALGGGCDDESGEDAGGVDADRTGSDSAGTGGTGGGDSDASSPDATQTPDADAAGTDTDLGVDSETADSAVPDSEPDEGQASFDATVSQPDSARPNPDSEAPNPDSMPPVPDAVPPNPDSAAPPPDAVPPNPDSAAPPPDALPPNVDSAPPMPDAVPPGPDSTRDAAPPNRDSEPPDPDAAPPPPDAVPPPPDGGAPVTPSCDLPQGNPAVNADYAREMVDFVRLIKAYAECRRPGFLVFPQNAPELAEDPDYMPAVAGIGKEDLYYGAESDGEATLAWDTEAWEQDLDRFTAAGKLVLSVDYPFDDEDEPSFGAGARSMIDDGYTRAAARGYVHYATVRNLNFLTRNPGHAPPGHAAPVTRTADVRSWLYMLQPPEDQERQPFLAEMGDAGFDLIVTDIEFDGTPTTEAEIAALRMRSGALLISYLSIGEAETYRTYWDEDWDADGDGDPDPGAPAWLAASNPDWGDNYKVRYWYPSWQRVVLASLDAIIDAGFDGAYLDIIDAYECFQEGDCEP